LLLILIILHFIVVHGRGILLLLNLCKFFLLLHLSLSESSCFGGGGLVGHTDLAQLNLQGAGDTLFLLLQLPRVFDEVAVALYLFGLGFQGVEHFIFRLLISDGIH